MNAEEYEKALRDAVLDEIGKYGHAMFLKGYKREDSDKPTMGDLWGSVDAYVEFVRARATVEATTDCEMVRLGTDHAKCAVVAYASHAALESLMKGASDE